MKKLNVLVGIISILCISAFFEAFSKSISVRILEYAKAVDYYAGYVFFSLYIIPILIIVFNIKSLKQKMPMPIGILLALSGLVMSIFVSISKADKLGDFIAKYHPYIYVLPMFIISISLKAFNKKFALIGIVITIIYTALLIKYLGYPHHLNIDFVSNYVRLVFLYFIIFILQIVYSVKLSDGKRAYS